MSPGEFEEHLQYIGWSIRRTAERFGVPEQTIRRMVSGDRDVPDDLAHYVRTLALVLEELPMPNLSRPAERVSS